MLILIMESYMLSAKQIERAYVIAATARFLANGGIVQSIPMGKHGVRNKVEELDTDFDTMA